MPVPASLRDFDANQAWLQTECLPDTWADVRPKKLRWTPFHAPGRLIRTARQSIVRVIDSWPTTNVIVGAYQRIALLN